MTTLRAIIWCAVSTEVQADDEKMSLPEQEREARELCAREGWRIVDVMVVPGHSRDYIDIHELAADARRAGIDAFDRLLEHFKKRDFDVLVCRDSERFARTQSLHSYIVESVIHIGARIYAYADRMSWVDESNFRMFIMVAGYKAASDIERLVMGRRRAMDAAVERGLPTTSSVILSHRIVRDDRGRAVAIVVNEEKRPAFEAAARLLLEGVGWREIETELFERYGYVDDAGKPYKRLAMYTWFHNPMFWGHSARHWRMDSMRTETWVFDESEVPPPGVKLYRNRLPPMLTGSLAEQVKSEMRRRNLMIRGNARPRRTQAFSGLCICQSCGYYMVYHGNKGYPGYKCVSRWWKDDLRPDCDNTLYIQEYAVRAWIDKRLRRMLQRNRARAFLPDRRAEDRRRALDNARKELEKVEAQAERLINKQSSAPLELTDMYDEQLVILADRRRILKHSISSLERERAKSETRDAEQAFETIRALGLEAFWQLPGTRINQLLFALFGDTCLYVQDGEIVRIGERPPHKRHTRRRSY